MQQAHAWQLLKDALLACCAAVLTLLACCPYCPAGQQLMTGLGLTSDVPDTQQLLAWLEGRPRERFGIVLTHVQELLSAPAEEQQGFLDLLDNILHVSVQICYGA
jgi:hypothetical protein